MVTVDRLRSASPSVLRSIGQGIRRIAISRLVLAVVTVLWTIALGTWTLLYVLTAAGITGGALFEFVRTVGFAVIYLPVSVFSILALEPLLGSPFYQIVEPLGTGGAAAVVAVSLTAMYYLIALAFSVVMTIGSEVRLGGTASQ